MAHLRSSAALLEEDGEPAVGPGGDIYQKVPPPTIAMSHSNAAMRTKGRVHLYIWAGGLRSTAQMVWEEQLNGVPCVTGPPASTRTSSVMHAWEEGDRHVATELLPPEPRCLTAALCMQAPSGRPCALHRPSGQLPAGGRGRLSRQQPEVRRLGQPPRIGPIQSRWTARRQPSVRGTGSRCRCRPVTAPCTALRCVPVMHEPATSGQPSHCLPGALRPDTLQESNSPQWPGSAACR